MKLKIKLLAGFLLLCNTLMAQERSPTREASSLFSLPPFERAVRCIKFYEGFHQKRHYPYIGYGHRLLPGERLTWRLTEKQADSLLRSDLRKLCALFRSYGKDSLLLATLSYNVGPYKVLGNSSIPESRLIKKIKAGNRNFQKESSAASDVYKRQVINVPLVLILRQLTGVFMLYSIYFVR